MLDIPRLFFKEENRLGFNISEVMKQNWAVQLTMLTEIFEIAARHNIQVWLDYGSLLGAVRHHGFIPWDDDVDISVLRKDYVPLLQYLQKELPPYRNVQSIHTSNGWNQAKAVIASRYELDYGNNSEEKMITDMEYGFPYVTFIDLYPLDFVPDDVNLWGTIRNLYQLAYGLAIDMDSHMASGSFDDNLSVLEDLTKVNIKRDENIRTSIWMLAERISSICTESESSQLAWYPDVMNNAVVNARPIDAYSKSLQVAFEFIDALIPQGYETILRAIYGEQYYIPKQGTATHDYPFYSDQERLLLSYRKSQRV